MSAGILLYRMDDSGLSLFLVHPGGPLWTNRDEGAWSMPKGEIPPEEDPLETAIREFHEETGYRVDGPFIELGSIRQKGGKQVFAWAVEGNCDAASIRSNTFHLEWPPRSGIMREFPEIDQAAWLNPERARIKINTAQREFIQRLLDRFESDSDLRPEE